MHILLLLGKCYLIHFSHIKIQSLDIIILTFQKYWWGLVCISQKQGDKNSGWHHVPYVQQDLPPQRHNEQRWACLCQNSLFRGVIHFHFIFIFWIVYFWCFFWKKENSQHTRIFLLIFQGNLWTNRNIFDYLKSVCHSIW